MTKELVHEGKLDRTATADALREFLQNMLRVGGLELKVAVRAVEPSAGGEEGEAEVFADLDGKDKEILLARGGEVLKALEHLAFRALRLEPAFHEKIHLDCAGYRALRFEELRMTAVVARTAHRASGVERLSGSAHRKRWHRRGTPGGDSPGKVISAKPFECGGEASAFTD
jgi:predicted RNA-binding protein Jag